MLFTIDRKATRKRRDSRSGKSKKALCLAALASVGLGDFIHAADVLPTTKPAPTASENCFESLWTYLDSTAADCPLS
jgi:hypothetical protein